MKFSPRQVSKTCYKTTSSNQVITENEDGGVKVDMRVYILRGLKNIAFSFVPALAIKPYFCELNKNVVNRFYSNTNIHISQ